MDEQTATTEGPNHELFVKVLAQIEREPQKWHQGQWRCGSGMCFAGWACELSGGRWISPAVHNLAEFLAPEPDDECVTLGVDAVQAMIRARRLLGLSTEAAAELFNANNTLDDLYRISADILGLDEQVLRDKVKAEVSS